MPSARETALQALTRFRRDGAWPDLYLKEACAGLRGEEAALAARLFARNLAELLQGASK